MRIGFMKGIVIGSIAGALVSLFYSPQMKPTPQKYLMGKTRRLGKKTGIIVSEMAKGLRGWMKR